MRKHIQPCRMLDDSVLNRPSLIRRVIVWITLVAYVGQPLAVTAQVAADQAAATNNRPVVDATANGLPLVQITAPSAAGVSHNQYTHFNVDPAGLILNNSPIIVQTQQAGYVIANPNLVNGAARVILNEVTSTNASQLNGYAEVAGQRAEVIIANPNGLTCNGCGFINTSRGVLTTGTPAMGAGGSLDTFRVTGGQIQIGTAGMNGSNLDQLDLIARSVKVNGELWATDLNVITGANLVNYNTLGVQLIQGEASKPTVGIDVALLGGMYANKIRLVGTEAGVGVNSLGNLSAQTGDFTLDNQGQITLGGNTTASANLTVNSNTSINNSGMLYSQQAAQLTSASSITNSGLLSAQGNLTINAASLDSTGVLGAGIDTSGAATQNGNLSITTQNQSIATGLNISGGSISITATDINLANSNTNAWSDITLNATAGNIDNTNGRIFNAFNGLGNIVFTATGSFTNTSGQIGSDQDLLVTAGTIAGTGQLIAGRDASFNQQGNYTSATGDVMKANRDLTFSTTGDIINKANLEAMGALLVNAANIDNQAGALINANLSQLNTSGNITNAGRIEGNTVETHSNNFTNIATVMGNVLNLHTNNLNNLNAAALIAATQTVNIIIANALNNQDGATIYSLGDINIGSNTAIVPATGYLTGNSASVTNQSATIEAAANLRISANTINNKRSVVGVEWGPTTTGTPVVGTPSYSSPGSLSYTPYLSDQKFTAATTPAAQLLAGANMWISGGALINDYSAIIAGGALTTQLTTLTNTGAAFQRMETKSGQYAYFVWQQTGWHWSVCWGWLGPYPCTVNDYGWVTVTTPYAPAPTYTKVLDSVNVTYLQYTQPAGTLRMVNIQPVVGGVTNSGTSALTVPSGGLYTIHNQPGQQYLVVTDPRFTSYQNFVSSDYMLSRLSLDPQMIQRRLGDGFYEQKLVNDQIIAQSGRRYLGAYTDAQSQFIALLNSGIDAAKEFNLALGVELTATQINALKHDIVWMVERDVILPDGTIERVLTPQVYLTRLSQADIKPNGALIAANEVSITASNDISNSGTIQGRASTVLSAQDITNRGGVIGSQGFALLNADNDIFNLSGNISGKTMGLTAGRDIRIERTSRDITRRVNLGSQTSAGYGVLRIVPIIGVVDSTKLGLEAGISATDALSVNAGQDVSIVAASINSGGDAAINAGRDLTFGVLTAKDSSSTSRYSAYRTDVVQMGSNIQTGGSLDLSSGTYMRLTSAALDAGRTATLIAGGDLTLAVSKNSTSFGFDTGIVQQRSYEETVVGTTLNAEVNVMIVATDGKGQEGRDEGGNIVLESAAISSRHGNLSVVADTNVNVGSVEEKHESFRQMRIESKGLLSSTTTATRDESNRTSAIGSNLDGDRITIQSGSDINVTGSDMVATNDIVLGAGNNITLAATQSTAQSSSFRDEQTRGLFSNGGLSVTLGSKQQTDIQAGLTTTYTASTVGSIMGNVSMHAGKRYAQTGSDVLTPQGNIDIAAQNVLIDEAQNTGSNTTESKSKQSGLTVAVSNPVVNAAQTAKQMGKAASQTSSGRMKTLAAANAALAVNNAWDAVNKGLDKADGNLADNMGGIDVSVSIGNSSSQSSTAQTWSQALGSNLSSGGNINIQATSAGIGSDLTLQGSTVKAGNTTTLTADHAISLLAAQNTAAQTSSNRNSSNSIGVGVSTNNGWTVNLAASRGRGNADGDDVTWSNTHVDAGNTLILKSGSDTTLKGASASGNQVIADIGGNLSIESLQDTSRYQSEQKNAGFSVAIPIAGTGSASVNYNKSNTNSIYTSVIEQSGIKAGNGGFQVKTQGSTVLKGGVIASSDAAIADHINTLTTASLTTSDIENKAEAHAESRGINLSNDMMTQGKYGVTKGVIGNALNNASESGSTSGQTRSAVSEGTVNITDEAMQIELTGKDVQDTVASLNRDTANAQVTAQRLDVLAMERTALAEQAIKQQAFKEVTVHTDAAYKAMFKTDTKFYKVICSSTPADCLNNQKLVHMEEITRDEAKRDGQVLAVNGILNDAPRAGELAYQNVPDNKDTGQKPASITLMHIPPADTSLGELFVAGYEKLLAPIFDYTNADFAYADLVQGRGDAATLSLGHSRGTIVQRNAFNIAADNGYGNDRLRVVGVGGGVGFQDYTNTATRLTKEENKGNVTFTYMANDPVPVIAAGNPGDAMAAFKEFFHVLSSDNSAHSCYGTGAAGCTTIANPVPGGPVPTNQNPGLIRVYRGGELVSPQLTVAGGKP